jgi:membrane associated rhomboid family serine protease
LVKFPTLESAASDARVHTVRQELSGVLAFLGAIWAVYLLDLFLPLEIFGLIPRRLSGIPGIVAMPMLHANLAHLLSNTVPLLVLLTLLAGSRASSSLVVLLICLLGGTLLWLFGRSAIHIGASLLVFGLITFLVASGLWFERRPVPVLVALLVVFFYGIPLILGVLPRIWSQDSVSWDGHLCGAIAGVIVAQQLTRGGRQARSV